jgi:hypothetical protein
MRYIMLKSISFAVLLGLAAGASAQAQTTVIETRPAPSVTIERTETPVVERRTRVESERSGCATKTVREDGPRGTKTETKTEC